MSGNETDADSETTLHLPGDELMQSSFKNVYVCTLPGLAKTS